jgi:hypothetical protein
MLLMRLCTDRFCDVSIQSLRNTTYIFVEGFDKLTTIEDLLWQAGQREPSSKPPKNRKAVPHSLYLLTVGLFFYKLRLTALSQTAWKKIRQILASLSHGSLGFNL